MVSTTLHGVAPRLASLQLSLSPCPDLDYRAPRRCAAGRAQQAWGEQGRLCLPACLQEKLNGEPGGRAPFPRLAAPLYTKSRGRLHARDALAGLGSRFGATVKSVKSLFYPQIRSPKHHCRWIPLDFAKEELRASESSSDYSFYPGYNSIAGWDL